MLVMLLFLAVPAAGSAESAPAARCVEIPDCAERFKDAQQLAKKGQAEPALQRLLSLAQQYEDPLISHPIGLLFQRLGRPGEAIPAYQRYLDSGIESDPQRLQQVRARLTQAQQDLATEQVASAPAAAKEGVTNPLAATAKVEARKTPLHKRVWLWTLVGTVAAGMVVGTTLGIYAREPSWPESPKVSF